MEKPKRSFELIGFPYLFVEKTTPPLIALNVLKKSRLSFDTNNTQQNEEPTKKEKIIWSTATSLAFVCIVVAGYALGGIPGAVLSGALTLAASRHWIPNFFKKVQKPFNEALNPNSILIIPFAILILIIGFALSNAHRLWKGSK